MGRAAQTGWQRIAVGAVIGLTGALLAMLALAPPAPALLEVVRPVSGERVGIEGVEVFVRFREDRAEPGTFRVLLNGADVTEAFSTAQNGAFGQLHGLLDGENRLRVELFGRGWLGGGRLYAQSREVRLIQRRPLDFNQG